MALENLNDEAQNNLSAPLYGKDDMLPIDDWRPRKMTTNAMMTYGQMVTMTEPVLRDLCNWVYRQYGWHVTMLQICVVMLHWGVAQMADESFFLVRWIQAWSEMSWVQLRANLRLATMPPRLADPSDDTSAVNLVVAFKLPFILQTQGSTP